LVKYNFTDKVSNEIKHIRKIFSVAYIKSFCYKFFKMIRDDSKKIKDALSIETLLEKLGDKDKKNEHNNKAVCI
jgi:hypothetical protein